MLNYARILVFFYGNARILVEVDISVPLKQQLRCKLPDGSYYNHQLVYEWMPIQCEACKLWGHKEEICTKGKPKDNNVMQANIEPLQRGLLLVVCLEVRKPEKSREEIGVGQDHSKENLPCKEPVQVIHQPATEVSNAQASNVVPVEGVPKKQKKKKKKNASAAKNAQTSEDQNGMEENDGSAEGNFDASVSAQVQKIDEKTKPPDPGGK